MRRERCRGENINQLVVAISCNPAVGLKSIQSVLIEFINLYLVAHPVKNGNSIKTNSLKKRLRWSDSDLRGQFTRGDTKRGKTR